MEQDSGIEEVVGEGGRRISRRTLIKGSAVVGATVWAAPVVESFTSKAFAGSVFYYCCACEDGRKSTVQPEEEGGQAPSTLADCVAYCAGKNSQSTQYTNYIWCGPSKTEYSGGPVGSSYGCGLNGEAASGCTSGKITYTSNTSYTYTSTTGASGVFAS